MVMIGVFGTIDCRVRVKAFGTGDYESSNFSVRTNNVEWDVPPERTTIKTPTNLKLSNEGILTFDNFDWWAGWYRTELMIETSVGNVYKINDWDRVQYYWYENDTGKIDLSSCLKRSDVANLIGGGNTVKVSCRVQGLGYIRMGHEQSHW